MSEINNFILLIITCFAILVVHIIAHVYICVGKDNDEQINMAIIRDIIIIIIYISTKFLIINL